LLESFFVAVLLGLRHATDPDHLTAVSSLVLSDLRYGSRRAGWLGLAWGLGHATTLVAFGLPVVIFARHLPAALSRAAEMAIGALIVALSLRLLLRWSRGHFHTHPHSHDGVVHAHPHVHEGAHSPTETRHAHAHAEGLGRSPAAAFGIGMVHGLGGSAGVGVLVIGAAAGWVPGVVALMLFAAGTAASMALVSAAFGYALCQGRIARRVGALIPVIALGSLIFGAWYVLDAARGPVLGL
jgi:ABC-type nickel/cobalt efflux system permease component RcnA